MENLFTRKVFGEKLLGNLGQLTIDKPDSSSYGKVNESLAIIRGQLSSRIGFMDQWISMFSNCFELLDTCNYTESGEIDPYTSISNLDPEQIEASGLISVLDTFESLYPEGVTVSDADGHRYFFEYYEDASAGYITDRAIAVNGLQIILILFDQEGPTEGTVYKYVRWDGTHFIEFAYLLNNLIESNSINELINDFVSQSNSLIESGTTGLTTIRDWKASKFSSVTSLYSTAVMAIREGGITGFMSLVANFFSGASTMAQTQDDGLTFTNNSVLVPQVYVSGIVEGIISGAATFIGLALAAINPVLAAAVTAIGYLGTQLFNRLQASYHETFASVSQLSTVLGDYAPYGLYQQQLSISLGDVVGQLRDYLVDSGQAAYVKVPGGMLMISRSDMSTADTANIEYRCEFHPSITVINNWNDFKTYMQGIIGSIPAFTWIDGHNFGYTDINFSGSSENIATQLELLWSRAEPLGFFQNESNGHLGSADDSLAITAIKRNTLIFSLWLACMNNAGSPFFRCAVEWLDRGLPAKASRVPVSIRDQSVLGSALLVEVFPELRTSDNEFIYYRNVYDSWLNFGALINDQAFVRDVDINDADSNITVFGTVIQGKYFGTPVPVPVKFSYAILIPKYDQATFWFAVAATVLATASAVIATVAFMKWRHKRRAINAAKVNHAYEQFCNNPTDETYKSYKSAARSNNRWRWLVGGTKYGTDDYWFNSDSVGSVSQISDLSGLYLTRLGKLISEDFNF